MRYIAKRQPLLASFKNQNYCLSAGPDLAQLVEGLAHR